MSETESPQFIGYPRGEQRGLYGSLDKLKSLGDGYFGMKPLPFLLLFLIVLYQALPFASGSFSALFAHAFAAVVVAGITCLTFRRIAFGLGWNMIYSILPAILVAINLPLWSMWAQGSAWGMGGFCLVNIGVLYVANRVAKDEILRYGIVMKGILPASQKESFDKGFQERKAIEANEGLPPVPKDMMSPPKSTAMN